MPGIRSFVAVELSDEAREALESLQRDLRDRVSPHAVRWTRPESIHLTLKFLGEVAPGKIKQIVAALQEVGIAHPPFAFEIAGVGVFPNPKRPRVVWAGITESSGVLVALQSDVARVLAPLGFEPDKRPFKPHLTVGRAGRRTGRRELAELGEVIAQTEVGRLEQVTVDHVSLMKSDLRPSGAVYSQQAVIPLTGEG